MALTGSRLDLPSPPRGKAPLGAWPAFEKRLAETLGALEEDQYLIVTEKRGWVYVQFAAQGSYGLRAECVGNSYLDEAHALSAGQTARLGKIGWSSPKGPQSPNFYRDFERPVPCADAARMAVRALTEVFELPHPGTYVRVLDDPLCIRLFSPMLENVEEDDRLLGRLNELNAEMRLARFFVTEGRVIVAAELFVAPFVAEHVKRACVQLGSLADRIGGELVEEMSEDRERRETPRR